MLQYWIWTTIPILQKRNVRDRKEASFSEGRIFDRWARKQGSCLQMRGSFFFFFFFAAFEVVQSHLVTVKLGFTCKNLFPWQHWFLIFFSLSLFSFHDLHEKWLECCYADMLALFDWQCCHMYPELQWHWHFHFS